MTSSYELNNLADQWEEKLAAAQNSLRAQTQDLCNAETHQELLHILTRCAAMNLAVSFSEVEQLRRQLARQGLLET